MNILALIQSHKIIEFVMMVLCKVVCKHHHTRKRCIINEGRYCASGITHFLTICYPSIVIDSFSIISNDKFKLNIETHYTLQLI